MSVTTLLAKPIAAARWTLRHRLPRSLLMITLVFGVPGIFHGMAWLDHASSYNGICGPHATDIPAHPCTREVYMSEFNAGFGGMALMMGELMIAFVTFVVTFIAWVSIDNRVQTRKMRQISD